MDVHELDQTLERLRTATDRAGANLFELDQTPARALLAAARLEGQSAPRWEEAEQALADLFQSYASLCTVLDAAVTARGHGPMLPAARRAEVAQLLVGPSVAMPERAVPLAERDLLSRSRTLQRCTPHDLLGWMAAAFALARSVVVAAGEAWEVGGAKVEMLRERLAAVVESGALDPTADDVAALDRQLAELEQIVVRDPLAYDPAEVADLGQHVDALASSVDGARRARSEFDDDLAAAGVALASLQEAADAARQAQREAKVRVVGLAPLPSLPSETLGAELDQIGALGARGAWGSVAAELADWRRRSDQLRRDLDRATAEQHDALERRRRLRGRLDAYTAKAAHLDCIEQPQLEQLRSDAEALLFTAPTDLELAENAVQRYQHALDAAVDERKGRPR